MSTTAIALISALGGALIVGIISILTTWLQQRGQAKRDLVRMAFDMATKDFDTQFENIKAKGGVMPPFESYVTYYLKYIEIVVEQGDLAPKDLKKLRDYRLSINKFYNEDYHKHIEAPINNLKSIA